MSKSAKKRPAASAPAAVPTAKSARHTAGDAAPNKAHAGSKQSRVIAMLQSSTGATIEAMMKATGWQINSAARGFPVDAKETHPIGQMTHLVGSSPTRYREPMTPWLTTRPSCLATTDFQATAKSAARTIYPMTDVPGGRYDFPMHRYKDFRVAGLLE